MKGPRASSAATDCFARVEDHRLHLSVITLGEIAKGIALAEDMGRDMRMQRNFLEHLLPERFGERILAFDAKSALAWGRILKKLRGDPEAEKLLAAEEALAMAREAVALELSYLSDKGIESLA